MSRKEMNMDAVTKRVAAMKKLRDDFIADGIDKISVKVMKGNSKTGKDCWTVSLIPILDCQNCSACKAGCYDVRNDCIYPSVQKTRAMNSAIHKADIGRYWSEISVFVHDHEVRELRINVGGDMTYDDFGHLTAVARQNPECHFLLFTKNYESLNRYLDRFTFPPNVSYLWSRWLGLENNNKHNVPEAHVLYDDGATTAPEFGSYLCTGNCSECHIEGKGCWSLGRGESVTFQAH